MEHLEPEHLSRIAEEVDTQDLASLRSTNKGFLEAVGLAAVRLRPSCNLSDTQLAQLCSKFPNATTLDISGAEHLTNGSLGSLESIAQSLDSLSLRECRWLRRGGAASLTLLTNLMELDLSGCEHLEELPAGIGTLTSLQFLNLRLCGSLVALPPGLCSLTGLQELNLYHCVYLASLPAGIGSLSNLKVSIAESLSKIH